MLFWPWPHWLREQGYGLSLKRIIVPTPASKTYSNLIVSVF